MSQIKLGQLRRWNKKAYEEYMPGIITCEYFIIIKKADERHGKLWYYYEKGLIDSDREEVLLRVSDEVKDE